MSVEPPDTEKRRQVERDLVAALEELLGEGRSISDLGVERIATRAGISRTAFYFYFPDKRALFTRVTADAAQEMYDVAGQWWAGSGRAEAELRTAVARVLDVYRRHLAVFRAVVELSATDQDVADSWRGIVQGFAEPTCERILAERPDDPTAQATAFALCWMTERTLFQHCLRDPITEEDELFVDAVTGLWLRAVYGRL